MNIPAFAMSQEEPLDRHQPREHDTVLKARSVEQTTLMQGTGGMLLRTCAG